MHLLPPPLHIDIVSSYDSITVTQVPKPYDMIIPPPINDDEIAAKLRSLKKEMSILQMERLSGVSRQVLYRIMGGSAISRSPYELVVKVLTFIDTYTETSSSEEVPVVTELQQLMVELVPISNK